MTTTTALSQEAAARVEEWRAKPYGWTGMTEGEWMAKLSTADLVEALGRLHRNAEVLADLPSVTAANMRRHTQERIERVTYELALRGALN